MSSRDSAQFTPTSTCSRAWRMGKNPPTPHHHLSPSHVVPRNVKTQTQCCASVALGGERNAKRARVSLSVPLSVSTLRNMLMLHSQKKNLQPKVFAVYYCCSVLVVVVFGLVTVLCVCDVLFFWGDFYELRTKKNLSVFVPQFGRHGRPGGGHRQPLLRDALCQDAAVHHGARREATQQTPDRVLCLPVRVRQDGRRGGERGHTLL